MKDMIIQKIKNIFDPQLLFKTFILIHLGLNLTIFFNSFMFDICLYISGAFLLISLFVNFKNFYRVFNDKINYLYLAFFASYLITSLVNFSN